MSQIAELERRREELKKQVEYGDLIQRLSENHDFRKVFHEEFFVKEAARNVALAGDPALDEKMRADALQMALASGHVRRYLSSHVQMANVAEREIKDIEEALDEIRQMGEDS